MNYKKPSFFIKNNFQKSKQTKIYFRDILNDSILKDICYKITGKTEFDVQYVDNSYQENGLEQGYNKGRLIILLFDGYINYISVSEKHIGGRNSSTQSVSTAYNMFYNNKSSNKKLYYYFLHDSGNASTEYQLLFYRLMKTIGFEFLNDKEKIETHISPFLSIEDIMYAKKHNSNKNKSNNSSYITKSSMISYDIYGKTYGANKYETTMICYAISKLANNNQKITLYEMLEGNLKELPKSSLDIINSMNKITIVPTDLQLEKKILENKTNIRSPKYIYNLLEKLGPKKCACCNCEIPEIIQGAHIYPIAKIKNNPMWSLNQKIEHATNADNGIWLCENHHKLYDQGILIISNSGYIKFKDNLSNKYKSYLNEITTIKSLDQTIMTESLINYLKLRNSVY